MRNTVLQRILFVLLFSFILLSCGGGGGGDGGGGDPGDSYRISTNQINFTATQNSFTPASQYVTVTVNYGTVFLDIQQSGSFFSSELTLTGDTTGQVRVTPGSTNRAPGTYSGTITVFGCDDLFCSNQADGSPKTIRVSYTILPEPFLTASPATLSFSGDEGSTPPSQTVSLLESNGTIDTWSASVSYSGPVSGWVLLTPDTVNNTINVGVNPLGAGTYQAEIRINYVVNGQNRTLTIPVEYTASSIATITPASLQFTGYEGVQPVAQDISIDLGATTSPWTASVEYTSGTNWLQLTPTTNNLSVQPLVQVAGTYSATIVISYSYNGTDQSTVRIPVDYTVSYAMSTSQTSITISNIEGEDPAAQFVTLGTLGGGTISSWSTSITYTLGSSGWLTVTPTSGNSLPATLSIDAGAVPNGTYQANITVNYTVGSVNGTIMIPVSYTAAAGVSLSTNVLNFTAREGKVPAAQTVDINYAGTGTIPWSTSMNPVISWLGLNPSMGTAMPATISVEPGQKTLGNSSTTVNVGYDIGASSPTQSFIVNYNVLGAWATPVPTDVSFTLDTTTTAGDLQQSVTIGDLYTDGTAISWTASSDASWVTATPTSGDTDANSTVTISLVSAELSNVADGDTANITLTPDNANISPLVIPVSITVNLPKITNVTPNVRYTNRPTEVIVRGSGFNTLTTETVSFGGQAAASYNLISDTEIHVTPPANVFASPGSYHVALNSNPVVDISAVDLHVVDLPVYPATSMILSGRPHDIIHDPLRNAIFYTTNTGIFKLTHDIGTTWTETSVALTNVYNIALTPDSQHLFVPISTNIVYPQVNPETLELGTPVNTNLSSAYRFTDPAPMNNGVTLIADSSAYGYTIEYPDTSTRRAEQYANVIYSEDRDRAIIGGNNNSSWGEYYDASTGAYDYLPVGTDGGFLNEYGMISERAHRTLLRGEVFDSNMNNIGALDRTDPIAGVAVSPDGTRAYILYNNTISIYDISGASGPFPQIGTAVEYKPADPNFYTRYLRISQDGGTLLIPGTNFVGGSIDSYELFLYPIP